MGTTVTVSIAKMNLGDQKKKLVYGKGLGSSNAYRDNVVLDGELHARSR